MTSLPIIVYGFNEMDVPKWVGASRPELYTVGITHTRYTHVKFFAWMGEAFFAAALCTFMPMLCWGGADSNFSTLSFTSMHLVILGGNLRLTIEQNAWTYLETAAFWLMIASFELVTTVLSNVTSMSSDPSVSWYEMADTQRNLYPDRVFWITVLLTVVLILCPRLLVKAYVVIQRPSLAMQTMWLFKAGKLPVTANLTSTKDYSAPYAASAAELSQSTASPKLDRKLSRRESGFAFSSNAATDLRALDTVNAVRRELYPEIATLGTATTVVSAALKLKRKAAQGRSERERGISTIRERGESSAEPPAGAFPVCASPVGAAPAAARSRGVSGEIRMKERVERASRELGI